MAIRKPTNETNAKTETTKKNTNHVAIVNIIGTLDSVFVGKKYAYATIKVNDGDYYSLFKVAFPPDYDFPDDGQEIHCHANMKSFKGNISFYALT